MSVSWDTATATWDTVAGTDSYPVASLVDPVMRTPVFLALIRGDGETEIRGRSIGSLRCSYPLSSAIAGAPAIYAIWGDQVVLGPSPDAIYTVRTDYVAVPEKLVGDDDSNGWSINAEDLVVSQASIYGARFILDFDSIPVYQAEVDELIESVVLEQTKQRVVQDPVMELPS